MKVLIVDDERRTLEGIALLVKTSCPDVNQIETAGSLAVAKELLSKLNPDLVLLDINLGDGSGFDLVPDLNRLSIPVIFITAHEEFALRAFKVAALDYLLKPVDPTELIAAVKRAFLEFQKKALDTRLQLLVEQYSFRQQDPSRIVLKTSDSIYVVDVKDIEFCEADKNYTTFVMRDKSKVIVSKSIGEYEDLLSKQTFLRIHQSFLVNTSLIVRFDRADGGTIWTSGGYQLPVSSRKKDVVMAFLNGLG